MDPDATQLIEDCEFEVSSADHCNDGSPVGFLKLLKQKNFEETLFPIFEGLNNIGRAVDCHVTVAAKTLSRKHCCIEVNSNSHLVYDLGSSNKSRRNKMILSPQVHYELNSNDLLTLADIKLLYTKSLAVHMDDTGSETESLTESESMLPSALENATVGNLEHGKAAIDDDELDNDDDRSSDILQPTQHEGGHLIGSYNQIPAFVEDSFKETTESASIKGALADETVLETPPRGQLAADLATQFIPESDSETEADYKRCVRAETVTCGDAEMSKSRCMMADEPTQAYQMDFIDEVSAFDKSCLPSNHADFSSSTLVICDADIAPTQVFDAATQISDSDNAATQVFSNIPTDDMVIMGKTSEQASRDMNLEETQVIGSDFLPSDSSAQKSVGGNADQASSEGLPTQLFVEETKLMEGEALPEVKIPLSHDKTHFEKVSKFRGSTGSVINFSPQSSSTQVFCSDMNSSFLPTLVLETSDQLELDNLPRSPTPAMHVSAISETVHLDANELCTQVYDGKECSSPNSESDFKQQMLNSNDLRTQVYSGANWHSEGRADSATVDLNTNDLCTQLYDSDQAPAVAPVKASAISLDPLSCSHVMSMPVDKQHLKRISVADGPQDLLDSRVTNDDLETQIFQLDVIEEELREEGDSHTESHVALLKKGAVNVDNLTSRAFVDENGKEKDKTTKSLGKPLVERFAEKKLADSDDISDESGGEVPLPLARAKNEKQDKVSKLSSRRTSSRQPKTPKANVCKDKKNAKENSKNISLGYEGADNDNSEAEKKGTKEGKNELPMLSKPPTKQKKEDKPGREEKTDYGIAVEEDEGPKIAYSNDKDMEDVHQNQCSTPSNQRTSMRKNKGKQKEGSDFLQPADEKRKNTKGRKRKAVALESEESAIVASPSKKTSSDNKQFPLSSTSLSKDFDSQSSGGTRNSEIVDSSQMSDDDLPSLASLIPLSRISNSSSKQLPVMTHEPPSAEMENPSSEELKSEEILREMSSSKDVAALKHDPRLEEIKAETSKEAGSEGFAKKKRMSISSKKNKRNKTELTGSEKSSESSYESIVEKRGIEQTKEIEHENSLKMKNNQGAVQLLDENDGRNKENSTKKTLPRKRNVNKLVASVVKLLDDEDISVNCEGRSLEEQSRSVAETSSIAKADFPEPSGELKINSDQFISESGKGGKNRKGSRNIAFDEEVVRVTRRKTHQHVSSGVEAELPGPGHLTEIPGALTDAFKDKKVEPSNSESESSAGDNANEEKNTKKTGRRISEVTRPSLRKKRGTEAAQREKDEDQLSNRKSELSVVGKKNLRTCDFDKKAETDPDKEMMSKAASTKKGCRSSSHCALDDPNDNAKEKLVSCNRNLFQQTENQSEKDSSEASINEENLKASEFTDENQPEAVEKSGSKLSTKSKRQRKTDIKKSLEVTETKKAHEVTGMDLAPGTESDRVETVSRRRKKTEPKVDMKVSLERQLHTPKTPSINRSVCDSEKKLQEQVEDKTAVEGCLKETHETGKDKMSNKVNEKKSVSKISDVNPGTPNLHDLGRKRLNRRSTHSLQDDSATDGDSRKTVEPVCSSEEAKAKKRTKSLMVTELVSKPKVMFTGLVDENGQKTVRALGGEMVESIYDCTHLVTDQVRRTVKFLCGVARGLPIVSQTWLEESKSAGKFLDASRFLVSDTENEKKFNFSLAQAIKDAAKQPLLLGLSIHVTDNVKPEPKQMKDIIHCAGGKFLPELPKLFEENVIIVTCDGKDLASCRQLEEMGFPTVSSEYIMTGILQQKLDANLFRLTSRKDSVKRLAKDASTGTRKKKK